MIELVPFAREHFPVLISWFKTEAAVQWAGPTVTMPLDEVQLLAMLEEGRRTPPARYCWMACRAGELVGHVQLGFDRRNGIARLRRVAIAPSVRGQGLAEPMLKLAVDHAFSEPGIDRVELNVYPFNTPPIRTYRALGFVHEGTRRSSARVGPERWDTVHMGLLRSEWFENERSELPDFICRPTLHSRPSAAWQIGPVAGRAARASDRKADSTFRSDAPSLLPARRSIRKTGRANIAGDLARRHLH